MAAAVVPPPQFERSISLNDLDSALHVREQVEKDLVVPEDAEHRFLRATPHFSFVLPSFRQFDVHDFRKFLYNSLVDVEIFKELENTKILNWCKAVHPMLPLSTIGDGNCLMHAASLAMWGVNDRYQILRRSVYQSLLEDAQGAYHQRWQQEQEQMKQRFLGGYELTEEQWKDEWQQVVDLVSPAEFPLGRSGAQFGSLEEIHIFVLANVLRRTIILLSGDTLRGNYGESFSPVNFCGIYLPLNWDPLDCVKSPLVIGYAQGHFAAIVSLKDGMLDLGNHTFGYADDATIKHAIPLVKPNGSPLPVHFLLAKEEGQASGLLRQYLDCARAPRGEGAANQSDAVLIAKLNFTPPPPGTEKLVEGYFHRASDAYKHKMTQRETQTKTPTVPLPNKGSAKPCHTAGCPFFGCSESAHLCSTCLAKYLSSLALQEPASGALIPAFQQRHQLAPNQQLSELPVLAKSPAVATQSPPVHHQRPVSASSTCQTPGCRYAAVAGKGGLCLRCYEAERSAEELAASVEYQSINREPCEVNGCDFFGSPQQHNLCSRCYRHFCVRLEETLGQQVPGSASMVVQPSTPPANPCQGAHCHNDGVPVLYDMCLGCYTACIRAFINSDGKTVGSTVAPPPEAPSHQGTKPVVCKKGILCVSPGCFNERIPQLNDLCSECYQPAKAPSPAAGTTSQNVQSSTRLAPALLQAMGQGIYCSNGRCMELVGSNTGDRCPTCYSAQLPASSSEMNAPHGQKSPGLPAVKSPSLTTPTAPYLSHNSHLGQISSMYQVPSTQPGISTPGTHLTECVASSVPGIQKMPSIINSTQTQISKCATPNCTFIGSPGMNFLCSQCFKKNIAEWKRMGGGSVTPSAGQPERNTARKCVMEGCSNRSGLNLNQLCSPCFQAALQSETRWVSKQKQGQQGSNQVISTESRASGHIPRQTKPHFSATTPCNTKGCLRFGTSQNNGLCEVCFDPNQQQAGEPRWIQPPTSEAPRSPPASAAVPQQQPVSLGMPRIHSNQGPIQVASGSVMFSQCAASGQRCCQPMCTMFGTSEMGGLCSQCFADRTILSSYPHSVPDAPPSSLSSSSSTVSSVSTQSSVVQRECLNAGCKNLADPLLHNHCTKCFRELYPELAQREEYRVCLEGANLH